MLESPDLGVRVGYDPDTLPGGWTIHGAAAGPHPEWTVCLGRQTPVEIIAGFVDALHEPRSAHAPNVWAPLHEHQWVLRCDHGRFTAHSPDRSVWMQYRQDPGGHAVWWSGAKDERGNGWNATFTATTPLHLVQAFSAALASPEPVMRPRGRVPHSTRIRTTSVSVLPSHLAAWQQARIAAARAATWARNSPAARPRTTPRTRLGRTRTSRIR
ncbi:DUF317 domain-containing protein [Streptomyces sp. NPDC057197]|uniref:DUF317 domain-containing protein n=1 Tax=Streptomyces sp. NPDC057197 TaxID=3346045 RepID=UPI00362611D1